MANRIRTSAISRLITEAACNGQVLPVTYVADTTNYDREEVFRVGRAAGYSVNKRGGQWFETAKA